MPPLGEGNQHVVSSSFVAMPSTSTLKISHCLRRRNQLYGLYHGEGIFHGLPCFATDDSLTRSRPTTADFALGTSHAVKLRQVPTIQSGLDDFTPANGVRPPLIGRSVQVPLEAFCLRRKFRPLDILQLVVLTCLTFSTEETLPTLVGGPLWWFLWLFWGWFCVGFVWWFCVGGFCVLPPSICSVSFPSTMTWAHRPHGVRTRVKKKAACSCSGAA